MQPPAFTDILDAKRIVDRYLQPTPLHHYPRLSSELGFEVFPREQQSMEALDAMVKAGAAKWWPLIKELGIKAE